MRATRGSLRVLIVDDERLARANLAALLADLPDVEIVGEATNAKEALAQIRSLRPDLVLLDIEMPGITGMDLLRQMRPEEIPDVAFVTAYQAYAVEAFDVSALDYVLKPVEAGRLREVVFRAIERRDARELEGYRDRILAFLEPPDPHGREAPYLTRVVIRTGRRRYVLPMNAVHSIEASGNYVRLHDGKREHLHRISLSEMERRLDPDHFVRVHRSTIVNAHRVREVRTLDRGSYSIVLDDGRTVRVARRNRSGLERVLRLSRP